MKKIILILFLVGIIISAYQESKSIPAFARKYRMSCKTCHATFPRLKDYGDDFAGNAFQLSDQESPGYFVDTGDDELSLIRNFPVAARLEGFMNFNTDREISDFGVPWGAKFLTGGEITNDIAYYFYFYFDERGEVAGIEDAYIMFNNLFGSELDVYVGQFQISDPLFKRELRLTLEDYQIYKVSPGMSNSNLTYDRGIMLTYGFDWGTDIILEVVNGNGLADAGDLRIFDKDKHKNLLGRVSQDIGDFFRVGAFVLTGSEDQTNDNDLVSTNELMMWGPDLTISAHEFLELNVQYAQRTDSDVFLDPASNNTAEDLETKGGLAELIFMPDGDDSKWYATALWNFIESDSPALDYKTATAHLGWVVRRNLRLVGEFKYDYTHSDQTFGVFSLGFISAF